MNKKSDSRDTPLPDHRLTVAELLGMLVADGLVVANETGFEKMKPADLTW